MIFTRLRDFIFGPRHKDWRPSADYRWCRWNGSRWEYREMTEAERLTEAQYRAW